MEQVGKGSTGDLADRDDGWGFQREITMWTNQAPLRWKYSYTARYVSVPPRKQIEPLFPTWLSGIKHGWGGDDQDPAGGWSHHPLHPAPPTTPITPQTGGWPSCCRTDRGGVAGWVVVLVAVWWWTRGMAKRLWRWRGRTGCIANCTCDVDEDGVFAGDKWWILVTVFIPAVDLLIRRR